MVIITHTDFVQETTSLMLILMAMMIYKESLIKHTVKFFNPSGDKSTIIWDN